MFYLLYIKLQFVVLILYNSLLCKWEPYTTNNFMSTLYKLQQIYIFIYNIMFEVCNSPKKKINYTTDI